MAFQSDITRYYVTQAGGGFSQFYSGTPYQKGYGIGTYLGGLFRSVLPFLRSGAQAVGREVARAGSHVLADVASGQPNVRGSVERHLSEAGGNLLSSLKRRAAAMQGAGIKKRKIVKKAQSRTVSRRKKSKSPRDIFS